MKKTGAIILSLSAIYFLAATVSLEDSTHNWFASDTNMIVEIDVPRVVDLLSDEDFGNIRNSINDDIAAEIISHVEKVYIGISGDVRTDEHQDIYALVEMDINAVKLAAILESHDEDLKVRSVHDGMFEITDKSDDSDDEEPFFIADAHSGMIVVGSEKGVKKYRSVVTGALPNASNNSALVSLRNEINTGSDVLVYGESFLDEIGPINPESFAFGMEYNDRILEISLFLKTQDSEDFNKIEKLIEGVINLAGVFDESGFIEEVLSSLKIEHKSGGLKISINLPINLLEELKNNKFVMNDLPFNP